MARLFSSQIPSPVIYQHPPNLVHYTHAYLSMKMEQCSETSTYILQTPGNYPKESIQPEDPCLLLHLPRHLTRVFKLRNFSHWEYWNTHSEFHSLNSFVWIRHTEMLSCAESDRSRRCVGVTQPIEWHVADIRHLFSAKIGQSSLMKQINNGHTNWSINFILTGAFLSKIFDSLTVGYLTSIWILYIPTEDFLQRHF
jgi:hypothetical protein